MSPAKSRKRESAGGSVFPRDVLAARVRAQRALRDLSQKDLAARMSAMQLVWSRPTVSQVERGARPVSVDELLGLSIALRISVPSLLTPEPEQTVDVGLPEPQAPPAIEAILGGSDDYFPLVTWDENGRPTQVDTRREIANRKLDAFSARADLAMQRFQEKKALRQADSASSEEEP